MNNDISRVKTGSLQVKNVSGKKVYTKPTLTRFGTMPPFHFEGVSMLMDGDIDLATIKWNPS
jgi:hypothetical protein